MPRAAKRTARHDLEREALAVFLALLEVDNPSRHEGAIARRVRELLRAAGLPAKYFTDDGANRRIPGGGEVGNLVVRLDGTRPGPRRLFVAHLDSVELARGARPIRRGRRLVPAGKTALGADDRAGVSILVTALRRLWRSGRDHPPLTFLFTVQEEIGLFGSHYADPARLGRPALGFSYDSSDPRRLIIGAPSSETFAVRVLGRAAHAGVHPEQGVSAAAIEALALARLVEGGWFGRIRKGRQTGTANVGPIRAAGATNVVLERLELEGEARSHREAFLTRIVATWRREFERAARRVKTAAGRPGRIEFERERVYNAFRLSPRAPVVRAAARALAACGVRRPELRVQFGGLDANWLNARGIPTVTLGCGQYGIHSLDEYLDLDEFLLGCRVTERLVEG